ncbi:hypothetical protein Tco_1054340 [Tanacetum coccineum]|uniref:Uncharacterized protein n=1 Tax=Tanacetum coccineum TaxID=301880 RepID=A0ABQ5GWK5_9ASTR
MHDLNLNPISLNSLNSLSRKRVSTSVMWTCDSVILSHVILSESCKTSTCFSSASALSWSVSSSCSTVSILSLAGSPPSETPQSIPHDEKVSPRVMVCLAETMTSVIVSLMVSCYGEVILNLFRGGSIAGGDDGSDGDLHLLQHGEGDGDGDGDADDGDGDLYLLRRGASISLAIAALIDGGRVYGARIVFLCVHIRRLPLG